MEQLAAQAIVGTERSPLNLPKLPGAIGETLQALDQTDSALTVLRAAGILSFTALAGQQAPRLNLPAHETCPPEVSPHGQDTSLADLLEAVFNQNAIRLQCEALRRLAGGCVPFRLLPKLLDWGRQSRTYRPFLLPVLGNRGQWLARINPDWAYASGQGGIEGDWDTGSLDQRLLYLSQLRLTDPAQGRSLVEQALAETGAKERAALVAALGTGLSGADEDLLEGALKDRGKEVRAAAAELLARLPQSRYVGRMGQRLQACLIQTPDGWQLTPPEAFGADWKADALEEAKPTHEKLGPRAWWLYQLTCNVPLAWWEQATGLNPAELLAWAKNGEWYEALRRGWLAVLNQSLDPHWAEAFLAHIKLPRPDADPFKLALALPPAQREAEWLKRLQLAKPGWLGGILSQLINAIPTPGLEVSCDFARKVFEQVAIHSQAAEAHKDYALRDALSEFIALLPLQAFAEARACWEALPAQIPSTANSLNRFPTLLGLRQRILEHHLLTEDRP